MKPKLSIRPAANFPTRLILSCGFALAGFGLQSAQSATWSGAGADANWGTAANWDVAVANSFNTALSFSGSSQLTNNNNLTGGTATSITFSAGAGAFVLGGNPITLAGGVTNSSSSLQTINLPMATSAVRTITTAADGGDITVGGLISGAGGITKSGAGTLTLSGPNTFTNDMTVSAGTLKNGSATTFTNLNALILNGTGTFDLNGFNATFAQEGGSLAANTIINNGAADATLKISDDQFGSYAGLLKDGPTNKLAVSLSNPNRFKTFLTNTGNTFSGGLTLLHNSSTGTRLNITQAISTVGSPGAITSSTYGAGPITIGQIATDRAGILINVSTTLPNAIVFNTELGNDFKGIRLEAPAIVLSGAITANNSQATFSGTGSALLSGVISGANGVSTVATGTLTLSGANTYTGNTFVLAGTLKNGSATTFTTKGALVMSSAAGTFDLNGFNASFNEEGGSVVGTTITNNGTADATLNFASTHSGTFAGLVKDGPSNKLAVSFANNNEFLNFLTNAGNTFSGGLTLLNHTGGLGGTRLAILNPIVTTGSPGAITAGTFGTGPITIGLTATDRAGIIFAATNNNTLANAIVFNTALGSDQPGIRFGSTGNVLSGAITANSDAAFSGPNPGSATVSGVISGAGGLSISEGVAITLTGVNTFTGNTTINGGSLRIGGAGQLGSGSYAGDIANADTLDFASSAAQSLTGIISGDGDLIADGGGGNTLTLTGANTYSGDTTITSGTLRLGSGSTTGSIDPASTITDNANLTINRSDTVMQGVHFGPVSGTGSFTQAGSGTTILTSDNTYNGPTHIAAGTLLIPGTGNVTSVDVAAASTLGVRSEGGGETLTAPDVTFASGNFLADFNNLANPSAPLLTTGTLTLNGNVVVFPANLGLLTSGSINLINYAAKTGPGTFSLNSPTIGTRSTATLSDTGSDIVLNLVTDKPKWTGLSSSTWSTATIGSPKNWKLNTAGTATDYLQGDDVLFDDSAAGTRTINISAANVLPASTVFTTSAGNYKLTSSGGFGIAGSGALVKNGGGTVVITTTNTYTGTTTIDDGTLQLGDGTTDGSIAGTSSIVTNGTLAFENLTNKTVPAGISGIGGITKSGPGGLNLSGVNTYEGDTTLNAGLLTLGSSTALGTFGSLTINGGSLDSSVPNLVLTNDNPQNWNADIDFMGTNSLDLGAGTVTLGGNRQVNVAANTLTIGGSIDGIGFDLTKAGAGKLVLGGYNFYDGGTTLAAGIVEIKDGGALGFGNIDFTGGILEYAAGVTADYSSQIAGGTSTGPVAIRLNGTVNFFTGLTSDQSGGLSLLGATNAAVLRLNTPNSYVGDTIIDLGMIQLGDNEVIPDGSVVRMTGGFANATSTKLEIQGNTETIAGLSGDGIVQCKESGPAPSVPGTIIIDTAGQDHTFNGLVRNQTGTLAVVKNGLGTQTFVNTSITVGTALTANDFSGGLTINGGTVKLRDSGNLNRVVSALRSDVTIASGASLALENTVVANTSTVIKSISGEGSVEISSGNLGIINLAGLNSYTGDTTVASGKLIVSTNSTTTFADTSTVSIASGAVLELPNAATDTVASLVINGSALPAGLYDAATPATTGFITGSGKIQVGPAGYSSWAALNVGGSPADVDTDLDGVQNGVEYFMDAAAGFTANPTVVTAGSVRTVTWPNGGNIPFGDYGTQFKVQTSEDLTTWADVLSGDVNLNNTSGSVIYTLPTGAGVIFVRLSVTPN